MNYRLLLFIYLLTVCHFTKAADLEKGFISKIIAENLDPTTMTVAPDGRVFLLDKKGQIMIVENDILLETPFLSLEVDNFNERGLAGIVLDPHFEQNGFVYVYYTPKNANHNRVSRFTATGNVAMPGSELVLLNINRLSSGVHNGGALVFGPEGKLYIGTGDGGSANDAQSLNTLLGKILRINPDGSIPEDNPFYDQVKGQNRAIWAYGLRNPFSMAFDPVTQIMLANDVGAANYEEVNSVEKGKNYGWPVVEGPLGERTPPENYQDPLYYYDRTVGCCIIGAAYYRPQEVSFPQEYIGKFFYTDYCSGIITVFNPVTGLPEGTLASGLDRPVALTISPKGDLYFLQRSGLRDSSIDDNTSTGDGALWKVSYSGDDAPFIARNPVTVKVSVNENARFEVVASGEQPLTYTWSVNDVAVPNNNAPVLILEAVESHLNNASIQCTISNAHGSVQTIPVRLLVTSNTRPVPQIVSPGDDFKYEGGKIIEFRGLATDQEDGVIVQENFKWEILFHHDTHTHPAMSPVSGSSSGSYTVPKVGETSTNVWYRLYLTVTDSEGLSQTVFKDIFPKKAKVIVESSPENYPVIVDGKTVDSPYEFEAVVGMTRAVEPSVDFYAHQKGFYLFDSWGEQNDSRILHFDVPENGGKYTAQYKIKRPGKGSGLVGKYYNSLEEFEEDTPALVRVDSTVDFSWGPGSPADEINQDNFYARWTGFIRPFNTGTYTFEVSSDDGVRLWVNNEPVVNDWNRHPFTKSEGTMYLEEGKQYPLRLEYFEGSGDAAVKLAWTNKSFLTQTTPQTQLYEEELVTGKPKEYPLELRSTAFPNPFSQELNISLTGHEGTTWYSLRDVQGRIILKEQILTKDSRITTLKDIKGLAAGLYLITLRSSKKHEVIRLTKTH